MRADHVPNGRAHRQNAHTSLRCRRQHEQSPLRNEWLEPRSSRLGMVLAKNCPITEGVPIKISNVTHCPSALMRFALAWSERDRISDRTNWH